VNHHILSPVLIATSVLLGAGTIQAAAAPQCPPDAKIYINPDLVPQRKKITREQAVAIMSDPNIPEWLRRQTHEEFYNQFQPIQMPFGNGYVMISSVNPCLQQYIETSGTK
jgi:hypothetical protein